MSMLSNFLSPVETYRVTGRDGVERVKRRQALYFVEAVKQAIEDRPGEHEIVYVEQKSLTKQEFVPQVDINNIVKRYRVTGLVPQLPGQPVYGDFSNIPDYQESLNVVLRAQEAFGRLSSDVRTFFDNDPANMLAFLSDPANRDQAIELGLVKPAAPAPGATLDDVVSELKTANERSSEGSKSP